VTCPYICGRDHDDEVTSCMVHLGCDYEGQKDACPWYWREQYAQANDRAEAAEAKVEALVKIAKEDNP